MRLGLRRGMLWLLILVAVLVALRAVLPIAVQRYVNNKLDQAENYDGEVGDIDLHLYRGAYEIEDVRIVKTDGDVPTPLFRADEVDLSVHWGALIHGALVGEIWMVRPELNFVDSESDENVQTGVDVPWQQIVQDLFPLKIDQFVIEQGQIHFRNFGSDPPVDIYLQNVYARLSNFTNSLDVSDTLIATLEMTAEPMSQGDLDVRLRFDPYTQQPQFDLNAQLTNLKVSSLNDFIKAYANLDVEAGTMDMALELAADKGRITGYVKPTISNLNVFDWKEDIQEDKDNVFQALWEGFAGLVSELFENQPQDTFATRVPIDGQVENPDTGVLNAVFTILRHAFLEAIQPGVEGSVNLKDVNDDQQKEDSQRKEDSQHKDNAENAD